MTLDKEIATGKYVSCGLPFDSYFKTLPLAIDVPGFGQGRPKNVNNAWLRVYRSTNFQVGPNEARLVPAPQYTQNDALLTEEVEVTLRPSWNSDGSVYVLQDKPLPLTVTGMTVEVSIGG